MIDKFREDENGELIKASQNRNMELVSLLPAICAIAQKILSVIIYQRTLEDLTGK